MFRNGTMKAILKNQKSPDTKYSVRFAESFKINLRAEQIDLYNWITEMNNLEYISFSPAHQAMGSYFKDGLFFMTNVENIGTDMVVQHYELQYFSPGHIQLYSDASRAYIMRWFPVTVGVPWEMQIRAISSTTCELVCLVGADYPTLALKAAAWLNGLAGLFLSKHLRREGRAFAKNIEEKFSERQSWGI